MNKNYNNKGVKDMFKEIGERIKSRRKELKLSLRQLGDQSGVSASFLSDIETGKAFPSMEKSAEIAAALNVPISWLFGETELQDSDDVLMNNIEKNGIIYDIFLSKHVFPNGLTYEQMYAIIKEHEELKKILTSKFLPNAQEDKKNDKDK
jgi:transcriptional regulator with XRE-family HTH domain